MDHLVPEVRSKEFPYVPKKPDGIDWRAYNLAQEKEFPEVIQSIGKFVDLAVASGAAPSRTETSQASHFLGSGGGRLR